MDSVWVRVQALSEASQYAHVDLFFFWTKLKD